MNDKCETCLRVCDVTNALCRACHQGSNWIEGPRREVQKPATVKSCDTCSYVSVFPSPQHCNDCDDDLSGYEPSAVFDEERIDVVGANGNDGLHYGEDVDNTAPGFLRRAAVIMDERGKTYDQAGGERSMGKTVAAFNAITGRDLTEAEGWLLLETLKNVRQWQRPAFHQDSADDGVAYSALKAEALARGA